jgi:hypothetical protein
MIFWIIVAVAAIFVGWFIYLGIVGDWFMALAGIFITALVGGFAVFLAIIIGFSTLWSTDSETHTYQLKAISTGQEVHGSFAGGFFVSYGEVDGERALQFIRQSHGGYHLESAPTDDSVLFERAGAPIVKVTSYSGFWWWLCPWTNTDYANTYKFYVPKGSVLSDYTIDNSK